MRRRSVSHGLMLGPLMAMLGIGSGINMRSQAAPKSTTSNGLPNSPSPRTLRKQARRQEMVHDIGVGFLDGRLTEREKGILLGKVKVPEAVPAEAPQ